MKSLLVWILLFVPAGLFSQSINPVSFGVHANLATINMAQPLDNVYGSGFGGGAHLDFNLVLISLRVSGDYISFGADHDKYRDALNSIPGVNVTSVGGGRLSIISGHVNAKLPILPIPIISPYATGGIGLARISASDVEVTQASGTTNVAIESETNTSVNLGAGVDVTLGVTIFLEARYTWIFTKDETSTYIPVTLGITF